MIQNKTLGSLLVALGIILLFALTFAKIDIDKQSTVLCEKFHEANDMKNCPVHKSNLSWLIIVAYAVNFLILLVGFYLLFFTKINEEVKKEFKNVDVSKLDEEERRFYDIIKHKDGSAFQTDLIKETGFSKVKTTRILDKLEMKGVLERKRRGMTNIIVLR